MYIALNRFRRKRIESVNNKIQFIRVANEMDRKHVRVRLCASWSFALEHRGRKGYSWVRYRNFFHPWDRP